MAGFGKWLKNARQDAGFSQSKLASCIGLDDYKYIGLLENETPHSKSGQPREPSISFLKKLATCLNKPVIETLSFAAGVEKELAQLVDGNGQSTAIASRRVVTPRRKNTPAKKNKAG